MKILAIRGKNLASLEAEFELDFTAGPLSSAGIFAITGPTGSGKSTILDALCLALFDHTPRLDQADSTREGVIPDVGDTTLAQKDSRTVLRRGAADGYAEVDFLSSRGDRFRATWSVRRAGNRRDGALRPQTLRLVNLSKGEEVQGQKRELLAAISEQLGFTFEQFTRSVLLAQGDFAMFLKAGRQEKAALLERLTGIGIYSRISTAIYEKSKQAEYDYMLLQQKIREVALLTDEQTAALTAEKNTLSETAGILKNTTDVLTAKLKWLEQDELLCRRAGEADSNLTEIRQAIAVAAPRYTRMEQFDRAQGIRDIYHALQNARRQLEEHTAGLAGRQNEQESVAVQLKQAAGTYGQLEREQLTGMEEWEKTKPEIIRARDMDVRLTALQAGAEEAGKERDAAQAARQKTEALLLTLAKDVETTETALRKYEQWFEKGSLHRAMVPKTDLIIALLDEAQSVQQDIDLHAARLQECQTLLETKKADIRKLEQELEQLNAALPAEIAALRAGLTEGEPCPVCGSIHHPYRGVVSRQTLKENELNRNKRLTADNIEKTAALVDAQKTMSTHLSALLDNARKRQSALLDKLEIHLVTLPSWQTLFREGVLQSKLRRFAGQWEQYTLEQTEARQTATRQAATLKNEQNSLLEATRLAEEKRKKHEDSVAALKRLQQERAAVLSGTSADEVERRHAAHEKTLAGQLKEAAEHRQAILARQEALNGAMIQIRDEIARLAGECTEKRQQVEAWIAAEGTVSPEQLADALSRDAAWVATEKQSLDHLKEQFAAARATLEERAKNLSAHRAQPLQAQPGETALSLADALSSRTAESERLRKRLTEIEVMSSTNEENRKRVRMYGKELGEKRQLAENWKKLNVLFGSADGLKFKAIAHGYTLDALLTHANRHLRELAPRYELQRIPDTLALQVADLDLLGEIRTVHSLSGGESFLISLALALGLSSLSSSRMKVESLFIDEGFGSLDADTLGIAMDVLERLQTQGCKIGIISHVPEMTERIAVQVHVVKMVNGKSRVVIDRDAFSSLFPPLEVEN
ncbi:MAG: AAA family ATPase [Tannerella sp.]|jgi:exonuclease SbcC|nr:AAA family ATPase [Tannerella sp.]